MFTDQLFADRLKKQKTFGTAQHDQNFSAAEPMIPGQRLSEREAIAVLKKAGIDPDRAVTTVAQDQKSTRPGAGSSRHDVRADVQATAEQSRPLVSLKHHWPSMPAELREQILEMARGGDRNTAPRNIANFQSLVDTWVDLPLSTRLAIGAQMATHPMFAREAVNFSAASASPPSTRSPKMRILFGRFVRGNEILAGGRWRRMTAEEQRMLRVK